MKILFSAVYNVLNGSAILKVDKPSLQNNENSRRPPISTDSKSSEQKKNSSWSANNAKIFFAVEFSRLRLIFAITVIFAFENLQRKRSTISDIVRSV